MLSNNLIFALDIGTRTVIGVVGKQVEDKLHIIASEIVAHKSRAMMDGQVHDIDMVAEAVVQVKNSLEKKLNTKLEKAGIAAAGRVLKTKQVYVEAPITTGRQIDSETISNLEMEGIQIAQYKLDEEMTKEEKVLFYCVGYSVVNYYLNGYVISNLEGHKGKTIGADIIATFLPNTVVDSLYAVMHKAKLEVSNLTLEPIAAINVAIPKNLRLLNLALVDIGAGTSDIAITREGAVIGFDMVPVAGDEITEAICHSYIVDFNTAERIKTSRRNAGEDIEYIDIMGLSRKVNFKELTLAISPAVEYLAETIGNKILEFNKKSPQAVFLIGGGSQIYNLDKLIAKKLDLQEDRVAVRKSDIIQNIIMNETNLEGPDAITPIGIAVTAMLQPGHGFIKVKVNDSKIQLFNSRKLHVADAIILAGFKPGEFMGKNGNSLKFNLNGTIKIIEGGLSKPSEIRVNGAVGNLQTVINGGDNISVKVAVNGASAELSIRILLRDYNYESDVYVNGIIAREDYYIQENDIVEITPKNMRASIQEERSLKADEKTSPRELKQALETDSNILKIKVNDTEVLLTGKKDNYIFVDIFNFYEFDLKTLKGMLITKLNGNKVSFTDILKEGDMVEIYWK